MEEQKYLFKNPNHLANLNSMRLSGQLCDVIIKVNQKEFRAHKNILAANLKYFQSMFLNPFKESKQDVIFMKDVDEGDLEVFISFAYTGEILLRDNNALGLLKVANYLNEDVIKEACIDFLVNNLKVEDACNAYQFANAIGCLSLENTAKQIILLNFEKCSQTEEYNDFGYEALKKIIDTVNQTCKQTSQKSLFEGIMRWVLHDVKSRQNYIINLLSLIDVNQLDSDYLIEYFCEKLKDQSDIARDIMFFYHEKMHEIKNSGESLMIIGVANNKLQLQFYNFLKKKWSRLHEIMNLKNHITGAWTISKNKFYYTLFKQGGLKICLQVFDPSIQQNRILSCENGLLRETAMCGTTKMLYFCGGEEILNGLPSDQVLMCNLQTNSFETLPPMGTKRVGAAAIFYQGCLHILGGHNGLEDLNRVEKYDPNTERWLVFPSMIKARYGLKVAVLNDKLYACGGDLVDPLYEKNTIEVYNPSAKSWQLLAGMNVSRFNFLLIVLDGKLLAIGGDDNKTVEVYDPTKDEWHMNDNLSLGLQVKCPSGGLVPSTYTY